MLQKTCLAMISIWTLSQILILRTNSTKVLLILRRPCNSIKIFLMHWRAARTRGKPWLAWRCFLDPTSEPMALCALGIVQYSLVVDDVWTICKYSCIFLRTIDPRTVTVTFAGLLEPLCKIPPFFLLSFKRHVQWFYVISRPEAGFQGYWVTIEDRSFDASRWPHPFYSLYISTPRAQWFWYLCFFHWTVKLLCFIPSCVVLRLLQLLLFAVGDLSCSYSSFILYITFVVNRYSALHYFHLQQDNKRWLSGEALTYQLCLRDSTQNWQ